MYALIFFGILVLIFLPILLRDLFRSARNTMKEAEYHRTVADNKASKSDDSKVALRTMSDNYLTTEKERELARSQNSVYELDTFIADFKKLNATEGLSRDVVAKEYSNKHKSSLRHSFNLAENHMKKLGISAPQPVQNAYFYTRNYHLVGKLVYKKFGFSSIFLNLKDHELLRNNNTYSDGYRAVDAWLLVVETPEGNLAGVVCPFPLKSDTAYAQSKLIEDLELGTPIEATGQLIIPNFNKKFKLEDLEKASNMLQTELPTIYPEFEDIKLG